MKRVLIPLAACALALSAASPKPSPAPSPDPAAIAAVTQYVDALAHGDFKAAYAISTASQQHYFLSANNLASNTQTTHYVIKKATVFGVISHGAIVEVVIREEVSFLDIGTQKPAEGTVNEPYFAVRENGAWRVKQLYQPWKSYAPNVTGSAKGVDVTVNRVEYYDKRIRLDCTIRNSGTVPVQVLPLGKTRLTIGSGAPIAAMNDPTFPLNDVVYFEGVRLLPQHQAVGFINFPLTEKKDEDQQLTLIVAPAIADAAEQTFSISVGPMLLRRL